MKRLILAFLVIGASGAAAQGPVAPAPAQPELKNWFGATGDFITAYTIDDGPTGSQWKYPTATQLGLSYLRALPAQLGVGLEFMYSTTQPTYVPPVNSTTTPISCSPICNANNTQTQYLVTVDYGRGLGYHLAFEALGGLTQISNFSVQGTDQPLPPSSRNFMTAGLAAGFGYSSSARMTLDITEGFMFLSPTVSNSASNTAGFSATRVTFRYALF